MSTRPLPKSLQAACSGRYADSAGNGWTEQDDFAGLGCWSHWIELKPGWRNAHTDPQSPLHTIHEASVKEALQCLRHAKPCLCEWCRDELSELNQ